MIYAEQTMIVSPRSDRSDVAIAFADITIRLTTTEAVKLRDDLTAAIADNAAADAPKLTEPVTPGRYRFGGDSRADSIAVVIAVVGNSAYGYHECRGEPFGALQWDVSGKFGEGNAASMNLVERLPDQ